jgi:hypothetical protein
MPKIETPLGAIYEGEVFAGIFEGVPAREQNIIRTDQDWGVKVDWEMKGVLALFLNEEFQVRFFLESMGPGQEYQLPVPLPARVSTLAAVLDMTVPSRTYSETITIDHTTTPIAPGTYKLTITLQLFDSSTGTPYPVAGFVEGPMVQFYNPG